MRFQQFSTLGRISHGANVVGEVRFMVEVPACENARSPVRSRGTEQSAMSASDTARKTCYSPFILIETTRLSCTVFEIIASCQKLKNFPTQLIIFGAPDGVTQFGIFSSRRFASENYNPQAMMRCYACDNSSSCSDTTLACDGQTDMQGHQHIPRQNSVAR